MAKPGITPIQLIAATNPRLCGRLAEPGAEADGELLDAIATPEEAGRTPLTRAADRLHLSSAANTVAAHRPHPVISTAPPSSPRRGLRLPARGGRAGATIPAWPFAPAMTGSHVGR